MTVVRILFDSDVPMLRGSILSVSSRIYILPFRVGGGVRFGEELGSFDFRQCAAEDQQSAHHPAGSRQCEIHCLSRSRTTFEWLYRSDRPVCRKEYDISIKLSYSSISSVVFVLQIICVCV